MFPPVIQLPSGTSYRLVATVNHIGESANSGHYISLVYDQKTDKFTLIDDTSVIYSVKINDDISRQVYIIVYTKD